MRGQDNGQARSRAGTGRQQVAQPGKSRDKPGLDDARHAHSPFIRMREAPSIQSAEGKRGVALSHEALHLIEQQAFPGNVRELENVMNRLIVVASASKITRADVENVLGIHPGTASLIVRTRSNTHTEAKLVLPPNTSELCEDETITAYKRRVKLDVLKAAITQYPSRTAAAERLGLTKDALKRQLRYLRNANVRSTNISTNDQEEV